MKLVHVADMKMIDHIAIQTYGIPSILLMSQAARAIKHYIDTHMKKDAHIAIMCGPGNNGGDGFALGVQLYQDNYKHITIYCNVEPTAMSQDEAIFANMARCQQLSVHTTSDLDAIKTLISEQDILIDALFGTGLSREIQGFYADLIQIMNQSGKNIISIDIASGIHGDTGAIMNCAIQADTTITFECYKQGQLLNPGFQYQGRLRIASIGIPKAIIERFDSQRFVINDEIMRHMLPKRVSHSHKGTYGKALMIGGSASMHGALTLAADAALHSGIGLLTLCLPDVITNIMAMKLESCMLQPMPSSQGYFHMDSIIGIKQQLSRYEYIVIGNGMGRSNVSEAILCQVLQTDLPVIVDADALYELGKHVDLLHRKAMTILTPHPKEMSYLTGSDVQEIVKDPIQQGEVFASQFDHVIVILKGEQTVMTDGVTTYVNIAGNHSLAKGGNGDVLCGMIAGLYGQCKHGIQAAVCGVYAHALAADSLIQKMDANSILPNDIINELTNIYRSFR